MRQSPRQVERLKDRQEGTKTSRQKGKQKGVLLDCQFCRTQIGCRPPSRLSSQTPLVKDHLELLSCQSLLSSHRISHTSYEVVRQNPGPRRMKETLATKHSGKINRFLTDGVLDPGDYKKSLDTLHTEAVSNTIAKLGKNPILDTNPPPIASSESRLSRKQRSTLAQLRSGQCHLLNDYLVLTGRKQSALCPECLIRRHTVKLIFNCDAAPTNLTIKDLWNNPVSVVGFLSTLPSFSSLEQTIPPAPPAPRPPPEPPPAPRPPPEPPP